MIHNYNNKIVGSFHFKYLNQNSDYITILLTDIPN